MKVRIEDLRVGSVQTVFVYDNPMWVKLEFADFTLRVGGERGVAVISSPDASLALYPRADNTIEIVRRPGNV